MKRFDPKKITTFDPSSMTEEEMDRKAEEATRRIQDYHDRKEQGLLSDKEKLAEINTQIFNDYVDRVGGIEYIVPEELDKLFVKSLDDSRGGQNENRGQN